MNKFIRVVFILTILLSIGLLTSAQAELAATLEVLNAGVEVQRVNTVNPIQVQVEAIVGVGDIIRTDDTGRARITFFADGTETELTPNTEYRIEQFEGDEASFQLIVEVIAGQTQQRLNRLVDANSSYTIITPGMTLAARGTDFAVRVEDSGRAGMLVFEGLVESGADDESADVPPEFGIRSAVGEPLSDVVRASNFDELDAAIDGCEVAISTTDDVSLNIRTGPSADNEQLGVVSASDIDIAVGTNESGGWYRVEVGDEFGWILSSTAVVSTDCAGLRLFPDDYVEGMELDIPASDDDTENEDEEQS